MGLEGSVKILRDRVYDDSAEGSCKEFGGVGLVGLLLDGSLSP
jgi:hypothetical protein